MTVNIIRSDQNNVSALFSGGPKADRCYLCVSPPPANFTVLGVLKIFNMFLHPIHLLITDWALGKGGFFLEDGLGEAQGKDKEKGNLSPMTSKIRVATGWLGLFFFFKRVYLKETNIFILELKLNCIISSFPFHPLSPPLCFPHPIFSHVWSPFLWLLL